MALSAKYHYSTWDNEKGGCSKWLYQGWFQIANEDGDLTSTVEENTCNTRNSCDKRKSSNTIGLFIGKCLRFQLH